MLKTNTFRNLVKNFFCIKIFPQIYNKNTTKIKTTEDKIKKITEQIILQLNDSDYEISNQFQNKKFIISNRIGELHEYLLSNAPNFEKHHSGNENKGNVNKDDGNKFMYVDLVDKNKSVFIELKNKYNTMNSSSKFAILTKLKIIKKYYPESLCCVGIINGKKTLYQDGNHIKIICKNPLIYEYSGTELFNLIYGTSSYYEDLYEIIDEELNAWMIEYEMKNIKN